MSSSSTGSAGAPAAVLKTKYFWATFVLACAVAVLGEMLVHSLGKTGESDGGLDSLVVWSGFYQRVVTAPRRPVVRNVSLVEIAAGDVPGISVFNLCAEREFVARLLLRVAMAEPAVIVIDKFFGPDACPKGDAGTQALVTAVQTVRKSRPVVVGLEAALLEENAVRRGEPNSYLVEALSFGEPLSPPQEGVINVAPDNRRIPLQWTTYRDKSAINSPPVVRDTLALVVSKLARPQLLTDNPRLSRVLSDGGQPYFGFLAPVDFKDHRVFASEALCGKRLSRGEDWRSCKANAPVPEQLKNRVVLIGENSAHVDQHRTIVGRVPGFYLQANYIEALLDDRFYTPLWRGLGDFVFSLLFLVALEVILVLFHERPARALMLVGVLIGLSCLVLYLLVMHASVYVDPTMVVLLAVSIKIAHLVYSRVKVPAWKDADPSIFRWPLLPRRNRENVPPAPAPAPAAAPAPSASAAEAPDSATAAASTVPIEGGRDGGTPGLTSESKP